MTDRAKSAAAKQGQEMSRDDVVRAHFEVQRDLHWVATLEPRFRGHTPNPDAMRHYREAWNAFAEDRDWSWWKEEARHYSNDELKAEITECMAEINALGMRQSARDQATTGGQTFHDIANRAGDGERGTPEPTLTKGRKI
jgi:hypothetical protein